MKNKLNMKAKMLDNSMENIYKLENLRFKAYGLDQTFEGLTIYTFGLDSGTIVPFGFYINDMLVGGCYVSAQEDYLYIEQLFVHPQLQGSGLRVGRLLLNFVLSQKQRLEEYFHTEFQESALEPSTNKAKAIYEKMGYEMNDHLMRKPLG